jgi:hypothetical protein
VEQELLTRTEQLSSPPVFSGVRVTPSLVVCACFIDRCLFFFDLLILITPVVFSNSSNIKTNDEISGIAGNFTLSTRVSSITSSLYCNMFLTSLCLSLQLEIRYQKNFYM